VNYSDPTGLFVSPSCAKNVLAKEVGGLGGTNDKYKHCVISCKIRLSCGLLTAIGAGIWKEIEDLFGEGNAEIADLIADYRGIRCAGSILKQQQQPQQDKCENNPEDCESCCKKHY